jgi:hypothetical protein
MGTTLQPFCTTVGKKYAIPAFFLGRIALRCAGMMTSSLAYHHVPFAIKFDERTGSRKFDLAVNDSTIASSRLSQRAPYYLMSRHS